MKKVEILTRIIQIDEELFKIYAESNKSICEQLDRLKRKNPETMLDIIARAHIIVSQLTTTMSLYSERLELKIKLDKR